MGQEKRFTLSGESRKSRKIILPVVIIILANLLFLQLLTPYLSVPSVKYYLTVSYPQNNAVVAYTEKAQGTYKNIPENKDIWVYVYGLQEKKYYPVKATIDKNNNTWQAPVQFGDFNKDKSAEFEIGVILVNHSNEEFIISNIFLKLAVASITAVGS